MRPLPRVEDLRRRLGYATQPVARPAARPTAPPPEPAPPSGPSDEPSEPPPLLQRLVARHPVATVTTVLSVVMAAFSQLWTRGALVIDGPGNALYLRLATGYADAIGRVPYWFPEMWAGAPPWALAPSFPAIILVPVALVTGADVAIKVGILVLQVAGGVGTYMLARSLWGRTPACAVAAFVYMLHPLAIAHGALGGSEPAAGVVAAIPWLIWSMRKGLRGDGTGYLLVAGLTAAFAVLHQAELAYALAILCFLLVLGELRRSYSGHSPTAAAQLMKRAGVVVAVALGAVAHWLVPFLAIGRSFVLSPPELVRGELFFNGSAAIVSREIGVFFHRSSGLHGTMSFQTPGLLPEFFYLSLVCVVLSLVTLVLVARREGEPALATVLLVALFGVWLSTGSVSLASSGPALRGQWLALAPVGAAAGLAVGGYLRRMHLGKTHRIVLAVAAALLVAFPFVTPFVSLQAIVPLLATLRFPRFYVVAPLGLALGAAYPITFVSRWAADHRPRSPLLRSSALAAAVVVAFAIDVLPYNSFYRIHPPPSNGAYDRLAEELTAAGDNSRVNASYLDPRTVTKLLETGRQTSVGWPHPMSGLHLWRLTGETYVAPSGYREAALGLSATGYLALEQTTATGTPDEAVSDVLLIRNPRTLPLVRTYEQAVVVQDANLSPLLAASLAARNVGVVNGPEPTTRRLGGMPTAAVSTASPCDADSVPALGPLSGELALACAVDPWLGAFFAGVSFEPLRGQEVGGVHLALTNGLRGLAIWLDGLADRAELAVYEVGADGLALGPELSRGQAVGIDEYGLTTFTFDPIADSAGRRFAFVLTCGACVPDLRTSVIAGPTRPGDPGNLVVDGRLYQDQQIAVVPIYDRLPPASPPTARTTAERLRPGHWRIVADSGQPSLMVVAETYFPGWKATIDGKDVPVFEADGAFVGIALPAGHHVVSLAYRRPLAADVGRVITLGTLVAVLVFAWRRRRQINRQEDARARSAGGRLLGRPRQARRSQPTSDALQMGAPPAEPGGEPALEPGESRPRPPVPDGEGPGGEGDEAVLAGVDDLEPGVGQEGEEGRRPEP